MGDGDGTHQSMAKGVGTRTGLCLVCVCGGGGTGHDVYVSRHCIDAEFDPISGLPFAVIVECRQTPFAIIVVFIAFSGHHCCTLCSTQTH